MSNHSSSSGRDNIRLVNSSYEIPGARASSSNVNDISRASSVCSLEYGSWFGGSGAPGTGFGKGDSDLWSGSGAGGTSGYVLMQGDMLRPAYSSLSCIAGFDHVKKNLNDGLKVAVGNALQLHAASNILGGRNCFLIGSPNPKAGKSLSYLIPVVSLLLQNAKGYQDLKGWGPLAIIVCSTHISGERIQECLEILADGTNLNWTFIHEHEAGNSKGSADEINERLLHRHVKYDIIVATAECFQELIQDHHSNFSFDRLSFLIFDDAHLLLKYRLTEVNTILHEFKNYVMKVEGRQCLHQIILCGSQWTCELEQCFVQVVEMPVLIISSPVQAVKYCKFDIRVLEANDNTRFDVFKGILSKHSDIDRIIVMGTEFEALKDLEIRCRKEGILMHVLEGEGSIGSRMETAVNYWRSPDKKKVIIATTDLNLRELGIKDASLLIHYDIPEDDLRTFALRFSTMWSNVRNLSQEMKQPGLQIKRQNSLSYAILLSEMPAANAILWKLHTLGASISKSLLEKAEKEKIAKLERAELCPGFKCMGNCTELDVAACAHRHFFVKEDFLNESILPRVGQVELIITESLAPNFYNAKILRYCERDPVTKRITKFIDYGKETLIRHEQLKQMVVSNTDSIRKGPSTFAPGTQVVVSLREKHETRFVYTRGQIINVATRNQFGLPMSVRVKCVDIGQTLVINVDEVFAIPDSMTELPEFGVQVVLANTSPPSGEKKFRAAHISKAKDFFKLDPKFHADISLSIGNTIWVKRLVQLKHLVGGKLIEGNDATYSLSQKGVLVKAPGQLEKLYEECEKSGLFSCEMYRQPNVVHWFQNPEFQDTFHQLSDEYFWAFLKVTKEGKEIVSDTVLPKFITTDNQVFVSLSKFESLAESLEIELNCEIQRLIAEHNWNNELHFDKYYKVGLVVAVKDNEDDSYRRGIITATEETRSGSQEGSEYLFSVLLVDLGVTGVMSMSELFPIPKLYVRKLPFQIIKLAMTHIRPRKPKFHGDLIYRRTGELLMPNNEPIDVEVVALNRLNSEICQCSSYEAMIFGETQEIGEKLVEDKAAHFVPGGEDRMAQLKAELLKKFQKMFDEHLVHEDDDDDDDGIEINFDHPMKQLLAAVSDKLAIDETVDEGTSAQRAIENESRPTTPPLLNSKKSSPGTKIPSNSTDEMPEGSSVKIPFERIHDSLLKADVTWCQEKDFVYIRVMIPDVQEYICRLEGKKDLIFETIVPPNYGFHLKLFKIVEASFQVKTFGQYCEVKLTKRLSGLRWTVLTSESKLRWLKPEYNYVDEDDNTNKVGTGQKSYMYDEVDYEQILENEDDSDEDDCVERLPTVGEDLVNS